MSDRQELAELERLKQLHRIGAVTQREYDAARRMIQMRLKDCEGADCAMGKFMAGLALVALAFGAGHFLIWGPAAIFAITAPDWIGTFDIGKGLILAVGALIVGALASLIMREA